MDLVLLLLQLRSAVMPEARCQAMPVVPPTPHATLRLLLTVTESCDAFLSSLEAPLRSIVPAGRALPRQSLLFAPYKGPAEPQA
jgi:hypothetical protein